jgi:hypothetical protein
MFAIGAAIAFLNAPHFLSSEVSMKYHLIGIALPFYVVGCQATLDSMLKEQIQRPFIHHSIPENLSVPVVWPYAFLYGIVLQVMPSYWDMIAASRTKTDEK